MSTKLDGVTSDGLLVTTESSPATGGRITANGTPVDLASAWEADLAANGGPLSDVLDLRGLAQRLAALASSAISPERTLSEIDSIGYSIGHSLVEAHVTSPAALQTSVALLGDQLLGNHQPLADSDTFARNAQFHRRRVARLQGAVAAGHGVAARSLLLNQQQAIHQAVIAARDGAESALRTSEARFRALYTEAAVGIGIADLEGRILEVNPALLDMLGYPAEEMYVRNVSDFMHPEDTPAVWEEYQRLVTGQRDAFRTEKRFFHRDGHVIWTNLTVSLIRDQDGDPHFQVAIMEDVTMRHRLQLRLRYEATHDPLTDLPNRSLLLERLEAALTDPLDGARVGLCFIDLDGFKMINDSHGHLVGDAVLVQVANRLAAPVADAGGLLARLGGDEFLALLTGSAQMPPAVDVAHSLLLALEDPIDLHGGMRVNVSASVGVVQQDAAEATVADLMRMADLTLHAAKEDGKGQVVVHDPSRTARQITRYTIAMSLPGAIDRGELMLAYQPLRRLSDGGLHSLEALLRWNHPQFGLLTPDKFIGIVEESTAIGPIGLWVLRQACQALAGNAQWPTDTMISVNVSVRQLHSPTLVDDVRAILDQASLPPHRLQLEVTESAIMNDDAAGPLAALYSLADHGVRIAMDDFGTGYSNLAALRRLPLHELKLAGTFLHGMQAGTPPDRVDTEILSGLVNLAHTLDLIVTAEEVETAEQDAWVRDIGCDIGQGWYYGRPEPVEQ